MENEFKEENVMEYARVCLEIADELVEKSKKQNFDTLLIPSRGAVPLFIGSMYALRYLQEEDSDFERFTHRINVPSLIKEYVLPKDAVSNDKDNDKKINVLMVPFTADINMEKYAKKNGVKKEISSDEFTDSTRKYWAKFVHGLTEGRKGREKDLYLQFYLYLLKEIEGREELASEYENSERVDNIAMIDTVISGRASTTIIDSFRELKIEPYSLLVIDEDGKKLKELYANKIRMGEYNHQIKTFKIPRIFTEDKGASLEGVVSIIYPSLMFHSTGLEIDDEIIQLGAGSWYHLPHDNSHEISFNYFCQMLKSAIGLECAGYCSSGKIDKKKEEKNMIENRSRLLKILKEDKLLYPNISSASYIKLRKPISYSYESGSHVIHFCFPEEISKNIINNFKNYIRSKK